ncbi:hypothetical protein XM25_00610 [Devosia sp. H5989]|nr:hypothetical protein XM25_00610 [Devosia sp. H5989]
MGAIANTKASLASTVADDGTFTLAYPSGASRASLRDSTGGSIAIGDNDVWAEGPDGVEFAYGASNITVTNRSGVSWAAGSNVVVSFGQTDRNGSYNLTIGTASNQAAPGTVSENYQELTASGAVLEGVQSLELNHASVVIAATMKPKPGLFVVKDTSATGTAAHTLTLTEGTFNGTNTVATLNARDEMLMVYFDSNLRGQVIANVGSVALS